jgi:hypothetical protein
LTTAATWGGRAVFGRGAVAALALVLMLGACGGSGGSGSDAAAPTATVRRSPTSIAAATTTAAPGQEDFTAILRDLLARRDEAYEKNDVSILEEIYSTQCACLANGRKAIEQQRSDGVHASGARLQLIRAELVNRVSPTYAVVRGVVEQPAYSYVDDNGNVVRPGEPHGADSVIYELGVQGERWVVLGITREGPTQR